MKKMSCMWVGTGTVGSFREQLGIDEIARSPLITDRSKVAALTRHGVKLAAANYMR